MLMDNGKYLVLTEEEMLCTTGGQLVWLGYGGGGLCGVTEVPDAPGSRINMLDRYRYWYA